MTEPEWMRDTLEAATNNFFTFIALKGRKPTGREMFAAGAQWERTMQARRDAVARAVDAARPTAPPSLVLPRDRLSRTRGAVPAVGSFPYFTDQQRPEARNGG
jgi:hypothetical protein